MVSNHDSRSPFFSLFSLTYSKAIISSCFHYHTLPELEPLEAHFAPDPQSLPQLDVCLGSPTDYNDLLDHPAELATPPAGAA